MTNKLYTLWLALCNLAFSLTAFFVVPFILIFTPKDAINLPRWASWYDTPDEDDLFDLNEPQVKWWFDHFGWFVTAYHWFGFRNRGHGFSSWLAHPAPPEGTPDILGHFFYEAAFGLYEKDGRIYGLKFGFGWQKYNSIKFASKKEFRPVIWIKTRNWSAN